QHVIYLQFDNTHLFRDRTNFASDLEQMPHLMNFLRDNGTLSDNEHTILISHTAGGILSSLTGLYPDRHGQAVTNSYGFFRPNGSVGFSSSFKYWTDTTDGGNPATTPPTPSADTNFNMVNGDSGTPKNTPAPWVPWARAGCDVGNVSTANAVLENNNAITFAAGPTTLAAPAAIGATNIKVGSVTGFVAGMAITIDTGAESATRAQTRNSTRCPTSPAATQVRRSSAPSTSTQRSPAAALSSTTPPEIRSPIPSAIRASRASTVCRRASRSGTSRRCRK